MNKIWLIAFSLFCGSVPPVCAQIQSQNQSPSQTPRNTDILRTENLVAWCIVPFDANRRKPAERAAMLKELGLKRCAYDWREEHVSSFEEEIQQYKQHGIEFFAFWSVHEQAIELFKKHGLHPQIWQTLADPGGDEASRPERAVERLLPLATRTAQLGCKLGLYNHGGWGGEPENMVAVCQRLRDLGHEHVGIVYNFHHGHEHIQRWPLVSKAMLPYLLCVNLNGMNPDANPKILGIGKGQHDLEMIRELVRSGYAGPIGILDHRDALDARDSLVENLHGLEWVRRELQQPGSGGELPQTPQPK
ncbi:MAG: TIM barrel protein [Pirellulaceae bacterium]